MLNPDWDGIGCILGAVFLFGLIAVSGVIGETYGAKYGIGAFVIIILVITGLFVLDNWLS